jgi:serine phosphatase RsbU (regulator of sigma subunit)/predicted negative regulator of RcsB-dependent stress response
MNQPLRFVSLLFTFFISVSISLAQSNDEAIRQFKAAAKEKDYHKAALIGYELGKSFADIGDQREAIQYLNQSVTFAKKGGSSTQSLLSNHFLGTLLYNFGNYDEAAESLGTAADLAKKAGSPDLQTESLILQARSLGNLKRYKKAIEVLDEALTLSLENGLTSSQLTSYDLLSDYHELNGNAKKSSEYRHLHTTLATLKENERKAAEKMSSLQTAIEREKEQTHSQQEMLRQTQVVLSGKEDSLHNATQSLRLVEESVKQLEEVNHKRQLEIDLLSKENQISDLRIQEQSSRLENEALFRNFILAMILLGGTLAIVIVINYRKTVAVNKKLDLQNKNIKSSINYAKRIQEAMLPKKDIQQNALKDSFILFRPRDVVSGDFYWFSPVRNGKSEQAADIAFGAIDCTGHGVPGAFMSMIGINSLNTILNRGITQTNRILDSLHHEIRSALQQEVTGNNDGMDAALCIYRSEKNALEFSGAKNPLVYIQNNEVFQVKGDIHPIGGRRSKNSHVFRKHEISINTPTMVYLFTDGFKDQFGGSENQKFMSKRFTRLLLEIHHLPMEEQKQRLENVFEEWKGANEQTDDVLVLGVKLNPTSY